MKDFEITIKVKNNRLKERRMRLGYTLQQMADYIGITSSTLGMYERCQLSPLGATRLRPTAKKILEYFELEFGDVWPDAVLGVVEPVITRVANFDQLPMNEPQPLLQLAPSPEELLIEGGKLKFLNDSLSRLMPREEFILKAACLDGRTYEDIGQELDLTRERIRQIFEKAQKKLRIWWKRRTGMKNRYCIACLRPRKTRESCECGEKTIIKISETTFVEMKLNRKKLMEDWKLYGYDGVYCVACLRPKPSPRSRCQCGEAYGKFFTGMEVRRIRNQRKDALDVVKEPLVKKRKKVVPHLADPEFELTDEDLLALYKYYS